MAGYIYLPVPTEEMKDFAQNWRDGLSQNGKAKYTVLKNFESGKLKGFVRKVGLGVLRGLSAQDRLYVLCHGNGKGSKTAGAYRRMTKTEDVVGKNWSGGVIKNYTPQEMAVVIAKEGLLKSFVDLRLFICGSAVIPDGEGRSFAESFALAMGDLGYHHLMVTGYLGSVKTSYVSRVTGGSNFTDTNHKGVEIDNIYRRASDHKLVFSSRPNENPPNLDLPSQR